MRKIPFVSTLMVVILFAAAIPALADDLSDVKNSGVLRFGTSTNYVPFVYMEKTEVDGLDAALVREIGKRLGVNVEIYDMAFDGLIDAVNIGQVDLIGGALSITDARKEQVDFANPYYESKGVIIGRAGETFTQTNIASARIGVQKGTSYEQWAATNLLMGGYIETSKIFRYPHEGSMMEALKMNQVDLVLLDDDVFQNRYKKDGSFAIVTDEICRERFAYAGAKGSTLIPEVNRIFKEMVSDGTAQGLANQYFSMDFSEQIEASITRPEQIESEFEMINRDADLQNVLVPEIHPAGPIAENQPGCLNGMQFVRDVTVPDGTKIAPNTVTSKTWMLRNTGTCTWDSSYSFTYVKGDVLGVTSVALDQLVEPNQTCEIEVPFTVPAHAGEFISYWQMQAPSGIKFGATTWMSFEASSAASSQDSDDSIPKILIWQPNFYKTENKTCPTVYWKVLNAEQVEFYVNDIYQGSVQDAEGSMVLCGPNKAGTHTYGIIARGEETTSTAFIFTDNSIY